MMKIIRYFLTGLLLFLCQYLFAGQDYTTYDLGLEGGSIVDMGVGSAYEGSSFNVTTARFMNNRFGFRTGLSLLTGIDGFDKYWKVPLLFSYRFPAWERDEEDMYDAFTEHDLDENILISILFLILPKQFEINVGPSLGYIEPDRMEYFHPTTQKMVYSEDVKRRFASSLDLNFRMGFPVFKGFRINLNLGLSYLLTRNLIYQQYDTYSDAIQRPAWSGDIRIGGSYSF